MEKEFVPYDLSVRLKELGFDEECLCVYYTNTFTGDEGLKYRLIIGRGDIELANDLLINTQKYTNSTVVNYYVTAPLWQQAFHFLLKKYYLYSVIIPTITMCWTFKITTVVDGEVEIPPYKNVDATDYSTCEEARLECLKKLIKLVKN